MIRLATFLLNSERSAWTHILFLRCFFSDLGFWFFCFLYFPRLFRFLSCSEFRHFGLPYFMADFGTGLPSSLTHLKFVKLKYVYYCYYYLIHSGPEYFKKYRSKTREIKSLIIWKFRKIREIIKHYKYFRGFLPTISGSVMTLDFNVTAIVLTANRNKFLITRVFIMF